MIIIIFSIVALILVVILFFLFVGKVKVAENITWGVNFSQMQAESLGLDWKKTYLAIINDLGVKNIKIHTQWDWIEGKEGELYFDDVDWQLQVAKENGVKIIYVVGLKSGRWPECHIPKWAKNLSEKQQKNMILNYVKKVVERYKDNDAITYWQAENEPFFKFGECPEWYYENDDFLKKEIALIKDIDPSRKIIISDSGESSFWIKPAKSGDMIGTTMYREVWVPMIESFGFSFRYPLAPAYYSRKEFIIKKFFNKDVICIELQAEPWAQRPFQDVPVEEQFKTMNLERFKENIEFAKETGLDTFYFWGVEWWYWLKEKHNQSEIWNEAKNQFINSN